MKILIVTGFYFPYINPRANRWTAIAEELVKAGYEIHVITSTGTSPNKADKINSPTIHRVGFNSFKEIHQFYFPGQLTRGQVGNLAQKNWKNRLFRWLNDGLWRPVYWPDDACLWYFPARRKTFQLLDNQHFDALITVSLPFTSHLVGLAAKRRFPGLIWLADMGDPLNFQLFSINNNWLYRRLNFYFEKRVLQQADSIVVTTELLIEKFKTEFQISTEKLAIIPPLIDFHSFIKEENQPAFLIDKSILSIGYFGSFFRKTREPNLLLNFIDQLNQQSKIVVCIHLFGDVFEEFIEQIDARFPLIKRHGLISRNDATAAMRQMDFLVNIGNATDFQLPSKAVDYKLSGLPVLNFCQIENDSFARFLEDYPLIINVLGENGRFSESQIDLLIEFIKNKKGSRVEAAFLAKWAEIFSADAIANRYLELLSASSFSIIRK